MSERIHLDATDLRILDLLQRDASHSNLALAALAHISPATCLRRVRRLEESGVIERRVAVLAPERIGAGLTAILEVTLDQQATERLDKFEARALAEAPVQQCYRVSGGPDFILIVQTADMAQYHALTARLLAEDVNVRNVRAFFSVRRSKFQPYLALPAANQ